jgi:hypothetical protein
MLLVLHHFGHRLHSVSKVGIQFLFVLGCEVTNGGANIYHFAGANWIYRIMKPDVVLHIPRRGKNDDKNDVGQAILENRNVVLPSMDESFPNIHNTNKE